MIFIQRVLFNGFKKIVSSQWLLQVEVGETEDAEMTKCTSWTLKAWFFFTINDVIHII